MNYKEATKLFDYIHEDIDIDYDEDDNVHIDYGAVTLCTIDSNNNFTFIESKLTSGQQYIMAEIIKALNNYNKGRAVKPAVYTDKGWNFD